MKIEIVFEDDNFMVINKPAGITVNKSDTTGDEETVQDFAEQNLQISNKLQSSTSNSKKDLEFRDSKLEFINRGGIVHRLDKETSGILLIAKTPEAFETLQKQFKERKVKKTYLALVHGKVMPEAGEINVPVGRLPWNRKKFGVVAGGREAVTKYHVSSIMYQVFSNKKEALSLVELYPETGRTHQIRVHLKHINHPIFADFLYAGRKTARDDRKLLKRVFLHASKISFSHPITGESVTFEAPLPDELKNFLSRVQ